MSNKMKLSNAAINVALSRFPSEEQFKTGFSKIDALRLSSEGFKMYLYGKIDEAKIAREKIICQSK